MENKNIIIIILVVIVIILATVLGVMFLHPTNAKEPSKIKITSNKTLTEGDSLSIKLTDSNNTALSNETVNVTITDKNGKVVVNKTVETNSKGKAKLDLDLKKGKYNVTTTFDGNDNFTGNTTTQNLTIKEKIVENQIIEQSTESSSKNSLNYDSKYNIYYDDEGKVVDPTGKNYMGEDGKSYKEVREKYEWIDKHGLR